MAVVQAAHAAGPISGQVQHFIWSFFSATALPTCSSSVQQLYQQEFPDAKPNALAEACQAAMSIALASPFNGLPVNAGHAMASLPESTLAHFAVPFNRSYYVGGALAAGDPGGQQHWTLPDAVNRMHAAYCGTLTAEIDHLASPYALPTFHNSIDPPAGLASCWMPCKLLNASPCVPLPCPLSAACW